MTVSPKQAVREALAAYLRTVLPVDVTVWSAWPSPGRPLPAKAVSVVTPGGDGEEPFAPGGDALRVDPDASPAVTGAVTYSTGFVTIGLQLDVWATFAAVRDDLAERVWSALNRHPADTLGTEPKPHLGAQRGLVLRIPALYNTPCDYRFDPAAGVVESSDAAQAAEWRSTWQGEASVHAVRREVLPLVKRVTVTVT